MIRTGKYISLLLRHHPEKADIELDEHGWTDVETLLKNVNRTNPLSLEELHEIAEGSDKKRYEFSEDGTRIRAVHGHSVKVNLDYDPVEPPKILYHGTAEKYVQSIEEKGLVGKGRQYVHLSTNTEMAAEVGRRHGKLVIYEVDAIGMYERGHVFYHSASDIYLTDHVPPEFLSRI